MEKQNRNYEAELNAAEHAMLITDEAFRLVPTAKNAQLREQATRQAWAAWHALREERAAAQNIGGGF